MKITKKFKLSLLMGCMAITLGATAASHQEWKNGTQYCKNDTVSYNGSVYQSQWCTTENPEKNHGNNKAWKKIGAAENNHDSASEDKTIDPIKPTTDNTISKGEHAALSADQQICLKQIKEMATVRNLRYVTKDPERMPTLYFITSDDSNSMRIRQEHSSGPIITAYPTDKKRYRLFFKDKNLQKLTDQDESHPRISVPIANGYDHVSTSPVEGWYQLEYSTDNNLPDGNYASPDHRSGGVVNFSIAKNITQPEIDKMIASIPTKQCKYGDKKTVTINQ